MARVRLVLGGRGHRSQAFLLEQRSPLTKRWSSTSNHSSWPDGLVGLLSLKAEMAAASGSRESASGSELLKPKALGTYVSYSSNCHFSHAEGIQLYRGLRPCRAGISGSPIQLKAQLYRGLVHVIQGVQGLYIQATYHYRTVVNSVLFQPDYILHVIP